MIFITIITRLFDQITPNVCYNLSSKSKNIAKFVSDKSDYIYASLLTITMRKNILILFILALATFSLPAQTKQASHSAALIRGVRTVNLINGLSISIEFNPEKETLWITGRTAKIDLIITEYIPLKNPDGSSIEIGKSYRLDNIFANVEYKILEIKDNRVTRIWFRVAATSTKPPDEGWI